MIRWQNPYCTLYQGDCLEVMKELPENSIQCVITSPPYWGLRKYSGEQEVTWGGEKDCQHKWGSRLRDIRHDHTWASSSPVENRPQSQYIEVAKGQYCTLCGAWRGAYGLEPTVEMYVQHTIEVLRAIRRVLKDDGIVWWNLGDSYAGQHVSYTDKRWQHGDSEHIEQHHSLGKADGLKPLDLCLIPQRVMLAAQADGWWVRSVIIWHKPNPMPESVNSIKWEKHRVKGGKGNRANNQFQIETTKQGPGVASRKQREAYFEGGAGSPQWQPCPSCEKCLPNDGLVLRKGSWRPTDDYEVIIMLTKSADYYADGEAVREPQTGTAHSRGTEACNQSYQEARESYLGFKSPVVNLPAGRNCRSVWTFPTESFSGAHFATFPTEIPKRCILIGTSEKGNCSKCGKPVVRVMETTSHYTQREVTHQPNNTPTKVDSTGWQNPTVNFLGWRPQCPCGAPAEPATVLDPFAGSGTTLAIAQSLGRRSIGIELSEDYCRLAVKRIERVSIPMRS
ncbi:MAG: site-specific DNA-methyltransferase [Dehalococcoidales bacterium]|nr:site-specific DNA-methyltransferase [Dehalococcoidales bacterium]